MEEMRSDCRYSVNEQDALIRGLMVKCDDNYPDTGVNRLALAEQERPLTKDTYTVSLVAGCVPVA